MSIPMFVCQACGYNDGGRKGRSSQSLKHQDVHLVVCSQCFPHSCLDDDKEVIQLKDKLVVKAAGRAFGKVFHSSDYIEDNKSETQVTKIKKLRKQLEESRELLAHYQICAEQEQFEIEMLEAVIERENS